MSENNINSQALIEENKRLKKALEELAILNDLARTICSSMKLNEILNRVVERSIKTLQAEQGAIFLISTEAGSPFKTLVRRGDTEEGKKPFRLSEGISGWLIKHKKPLIIQNLAEDSRFRGYRSESEKVKSVLGVPLLSRGKLIGIIILFNKLAGQTFSDDDQRMLSIIASQSAQVIENARLFEQELELHRLEQDLLMAREIQQRLLPKESPTIEGFELAGMSYPAREVGGDYFDFIKISEHLWGIAVGDVSGKGIPAALLMSNLQATLRGQAFTQQSIKECVKNANYLLYLNTDPEKFATLLYGLLDSKSRTFTYVNAGHNYPLYLNQKGQFQELITGGPILGMLPEAIYEEGQVHLQQEDILIIYSDGVTEAENELGELYGERRLRKLIQKNRHLGAAQFIKTIYNEISQFVGSKNFSDDITIVALRAV
ncbi:MAG: GAF domain-containing protein [Calditrichaeota bacterium]|nr:MAG: GAF domain-containing protein [Calditrichota bacterium]